MSPGCAATTGGVFDLQGCLGQMGHFIGYQVLQDVAFYCHYLCFVLFLDSSLVLPPLLVPLFKGCVPNRPALHIR